MVDHLKFSFKVAYLKSLNSASKISRYQKTGGGFVAGDIVAIALVEESQNHVALLLPELYKED